MGQGVQGELERKYDVDGQLGLPRLTGVGGVARVRYRPPVALQATYFDTPAKTLAANRVALCCRVGGPDAGWHVQIPAGEHRIEVHAPLSAAETAAATAVTAGTGDEVSWEGPVTVPASILDVVAVHVRGVNLVPVARLHTLRCVVELMDFTGHRLAEVCDDQVAALAVDGPADGAGQDGVRHWREWEVEVIDAKVLDAALTPRQLTAEPGTPAGDGTGTNKTVRGTVAFLDAVGQVLERAGARPAGASSTLEQVLGPVPDPLDPAAIEAPEGAGLDLEAVLTKTVRTQVSRLKGWDPLVRRDVQDSIHQYRVVCRTLRSILQTYAPLLDPEPAGQVNKALRTLGRLLSTARDAEVVRDQAKTKIKALPGGKNGPVAQLIPSRVVKRLVKAKADQFTAAHEDLLERMRTRKYLQVLDLLDDYAHQVPLAEPAPDTTDTTQEADTPGAPQTSDAVAKTTTTTVGQPQTTKTQQKVTVKAQAQVPVPAPASAPEAIVGVAVEALAALEPLAAEQVEAVLALARTAAAETDHDHRIELMHEVRKEAKRLRYAVKAVQDATGLDLGADLVARMKTAKKLQQVLGEHRDSILFQEHVLHTAKKAAKNAQDTFGYGVLYAAEFTLQQQCEHEADELLERLATDT